MNTESQEYSSVRIDVCESLGDGTFEKHGLASMSVGKVRLGVDIAACLGTCGRPFQELAEAVDILADVAGVSTVDEEVSDIENDFVDSARELIRAWRAHDLCRDAGKESP